MATSKPIFRTDLESSRIVKTGSQDVVYVIRDHASGERFEFSEKDYFLCSCMDGQLRLEEIAERYAQHFGQKLPPEYLQKLISQLDELHLLQTTPPDSRASSFNDESTIEWLEDDEDMEEGLTNDAKRYAFWPWCNPSAFFEKAARKAARFRSVFRFLTFALLLCVPAALYLLYVQRDLLYYDLSLNILGFGLLGRVAAVIVLVDILRCLVTGMVGAHVGARITEFGLRLRFGIFPRLYVRRVGRTQLDPANRLWAYGSTFIVRFILIVAGTLIWYLFRSTAPVLSSWGILTLHVGIIGFILLAVPFRISDGYRWLTTYFKLPPNLIQLAVFTLQRLVTRQPLPSTMLENKGSLLRLLAYALILSVIWVLFAMKILFRITQGLADAFPDIFGRATDVITLGIVLFLVGRWGMAKVTRKRVMQQSETTPSATESTSQTSYGKWGLAIVLVLCVPLPFRPGGTIELQPPRQLAITAPLGGRISEVLYQGGDGVILEEGTVVARITSDELLHELEKTRENIVRQEAETERRAALLAMLEKGPHAEDIARAEAALDRAGQEVAVATLQVQSADVSLVYSQRRETMLKQLYEEGIYSQLEFDLARRQAEIDAIASQTAAHLLKARMAAQREAQSLLDRLTAGTRDEELQAARSELAAAQSTLRNFKQQAVFLESKQQRTDLMMPLTGYLTEGLLHQKVGRYIQSGQAYTIAQSEEDVIMLMDVPEYDGVHIREGQAVHVRLSAFPVKSLQGRVIRVEPAPSHREGHRVFRVETLVPTNDLPWRPGITGYAKVHVSWKPLGLTLLRPLVRFFQVELWSWLP